MKEALYYNALCLAAGGDRPKLKKWKSGWASWEAAYQNLEALGTLPSPEAAWEALAAQKIGLLLADVIPGAITHPNFFGSNRLIRQGATLATDPNEILEACGIVPKDVARAREKDASAEETLILKALRESRRPLTVDKIVALTRLEPRIANQTLSFLLLRAAIKETGRGYTI